MPDLFTLAEIDGLTAELDGAEMDTPVLTRRELRSLLATAREYWAIRNAVDGWAFARPSIEPRDG